VQLATHSLGKPVSAQLTLDKSEETVLGLDVEASVGADESTVIREFPEDDIKNILIIEFDSGPMVRGSTL
jgi:hypothetical protein